MLTALGVLGLAGAVAVAVDGGGGASGAVSGMPVVEQSAVEQSATGGWTAATIKPDASSTPVTGAVPPVGDVTGTIDAGRTVPGSPSGASAAAGPAGEGISAADRRAGIATTRLVQAGTGRLTVVPGSAPAPSAAPRMTVRVEVEEGIGADGAAFASFVMDTLNDPRGWGHGGRLTFARTSGAADFRVILASPDTSAQLCAPARTHGTMSCGGGDRAVLTMYRWMNGIPDYGSDRTGYRHYLVNHEVGHVLGHGNAYCDPGHLAPVMVQQTKGLQGCLPNSWPFPSN